MNFLLSRNRTKHVDAGAVITRQGYSPRTENVGASFFLSAVRAAQMFGVAAELQGLPRIAVGLRQSDLSGRSVKACFHVSDVAYVGSEIGSLRICDQYRRMKRVKSIFEVECLAHNVWLNRMVKRVALCGGAGDFLINEAVKAGADAFLTGEMKYHLFFGLEGRIQIGVLGHYQSEQFTKNLLHGGRFSGSGFSTSMSDWWCDGVTLFWG